MNKNRAIVVPNPRHIQVVHVRVHNVTLRGASRTLQEKSNLHHNHVQLCVKVHEKNTRKSFMLLLIRTWLGEGGLYCCTQTRLLFM